MRKRIQRTRCKEYEIKGYSGECNGISENGDEWKDGEIVEILKDTGICGIRVDVCFSVKNVKTGTQTFVCIRALREIMNEYKVDKELFVI